MAHRDCENLCIARSYLFLELYNNPHVSRGPTEKEAGTTEKHGGGGQGNGDWNGTERMVMARNTIWLHLWWMGVAARQREGDGTEPTRVESSGRTVGNSACGLMTAPAFALARYRWMLSLVLRSLAPFRPAARTSISPIRTPSGDSPRVELPARMHARTHARTQCSTERVCLNLRDEPRASTLVHNARIRRKARAFEYGFIRGTRLVRMERRARARELHIQKYNKIYKRKLLSRGNNGSYICRHVFLPPRGRNNDASRRWASHVRI